MFCYLNSYVSLVEFKLTKEMLSTLRVNARPSRPSGKRTVNNFLSSLTTTLQIRSVLNTLLLMHSPDNKRKNKNEINTSQNYLNQFLLE
jgi:hypothetical protein